MVLAARGGLALIADPPGRSLRDRFRECIDSGSPGIPRTELLDHLRTVAGVLDECYERHGAAHLGLNPRTLLLSENGVKIAEFGLAWWVWLPARQDVAALNPRYSAPELFRGQAGPACDQYSLALIYGELLTGSLPGLDQMPASDRPALRRALELDPSKRWGSCSEFIESLAAEEKERADSFSVISRTRFLSSLGIPRIAARLEEFRAHWGAAAVQAGDREFFIQAPAPGTFWQRLSGRRLFVEVVVRVSPSPLERNATEIEVELRSADSARGKGVEWLAQLTPGLFESLMTFLAGSPRRRTEERTAWTHPFRLCSVGAEGKPGEMIECRGKDISSRGIGFYVMGQPPTSMIQMTLPRTARTSEGALSARVVRIQAHGDNQFEIGALLLPEKSGA
jgi:hypothetical protein